MKARLLLTCVVLAASAAGLSGCVVYPEPVAVSPSVTVRPAPYYHYGYGPRYHYYGSHRDWD